VKSVNIKYLPGIDHLRAFAAILIILYHGSQLFSYQELYGRLFAPDHWASTHNPIVAIIVEGHTAVGLFMVLSGFIFTYGALGSQIDYKSFIKNRLLRIYPLFIFLIVLGIYIYPKNFSFTGLAQTLFCLANLQGSLILGPLSAMFWAVAVEFQFYLIFPFLMNFMEKRGVKILINLIVIAILFRGIAVALGADILNITYWSIVGRIDQFIIGILAAKLFTQVKPFVLKILFLPSIVLVGFMLLGFNKLGGQPVVAYWKIIWHTVEGLVWGLFALSYISVFHSANNLFSKVITKIGEMSFSLYLLHFTVLYILVDKGLYFSFGHGPFVNALLNTITLVLPITLVISVLTYNTIEKSFLGLRVRYLKPVEGDMPTHIKVAAK
jgi:peptidoglycan/LPS O-acetylase OafA/YrhL